MPSPDVTIGRDSRLHLFGKIFEAMNLGVSATLRAFEDIELWYAQISKSLEHLGYAGRLVTSLPGKSSGSVLNQCLTLSSVLAEYDKFYFRMLQIIYFCCRLLVLQQATFSARALFVQPNDPDSGIPSDPLWFKQILPHNLEVLTIWGREAHSIAENILALLQEPEITQAPDSLGTTPDHVFHMITFSAVFLVSFRFLIWNVRGVETPGSGDLLLERVMKLLENAASTGAEMGIEHPAKRSALLIGGVVGLWKNKEVMARRRREAESERGRARTRGMGRGMEASGSVDMSMGGSTDSGSTSEHSGLQTDAMSAFYGPDTSGASASVSETHSSYTMPGFPTYHTSYSQQPLYPSGLEQGSSYGLQSQDQAFHPLFQSSTPVPNYSDSWLESTVYQDPQFWNEFWNYQASSPSGQE